jgi:hypothetical protein
MAWASGRGVGGVYEGNGLAGKSENGLDKRVRNWEEESVEMGKNRAPEMVSDDCGGYDPFTQICKPYDYSRHGFKLSKWETRILPRINMCVWVADRQFEIYTLYAEGVQESKIDLLEAITAHIDTWEGDSAGEMNDTLEALEKLVTGLNDLMVKVREKSSKLSGAI